MTPDPWARIRRPQGTDITAERHSQSDHVFVGVDRSTNRHLLVEVPDSVPLGVALRTRGLIAEVVNMALDSQEDRTWVDVVCIDPTKSDVFTIVASDIARAVNNAPEDRLSAVTGTLERWQRFWAGFGGSWSLEREAGLFGELWFLRQWLGTAHLQMWVGPLGNRHDFVSPIFSVEVKTTVRSDGSARHAISSLDQLSDPEEGEFYFFSLQVAQDVGAVNSVDVLYQQVTELLPDDNARDLFTDRLAELGWAPSSTTRTFRVLGQSLYRVGPGFPRITTAMLQETLPTGVESLSYSIDLAACPAELLVASTPTGARALMEGLDT